MYLSCLWRDLCQLQSCLRAASSALCFLHMISYTLCLVCVWVRAYMRTCVCTCVCVRRAISKEANSLVDRNCYGLEVKPLAAVMQVEPHKPHQSHQQHNEAELPNGATPTNTPLLLPRWWQAEVERQHAQCQAGSNRQARCTGPGSCRRRPVERYMVFSYKIDEQKTSQRLHRAGSFS